MTNKFKYIDKKMGTKDIKKLTDEIFELIKKANSLKDLSNIESLIEKKYFPKIKDNFKNVEKLKFNFSIQSHEINVLIEEGIINNDFSFTENISEKINNNPLAKILYATLWKNKKLSQPKILMEGITNHKNTNKNSLVFYEFGKYLNKIDNEPIVNQHIIRVFGIYISKETTEIKNFINLANLTKKNHSDIVKKYKTWFKKNLSDNLKKEKEYIYHVDKILFVLGQEIKKANKNETKEYLIVERYIDDGVLSFQRSVNCIAREKWDLDKLNEKMKDIFGEFESLDAFWEFIHNKDLINEKIGIDIRGYYENGTPEDDLKTEFLDNWFNDILYGIEELEGCESYFSENSGNDVDEVRITYKGKIWKQRDYIH